MKIQNTWVGYVHRTYQQIKDNVLTVMGVHLPEMTDHTESNPFIKFLSIWAGLTEHLNYYIDNTARELFLATARQYNSAIKTAQQFDYRVRGVKAATVDLTFSIAEAQATDIEIPRYTRVSTEDGIPFITTIQAYILAGTRHVTVGAIQAERFANEVVGVSNGSPTQRFPLTESTEDRSVSVVISGVSYTPVDSFSFSAPADTVFKTGLNEDQVLEIIFGDGVKGYIPQSGSQIVVEYYESLGRAGNLAENTITTMAVPIITANGEVSVTNVNRSAGGADIETLADLKKSIPLSIRTLNRAVTEQDYKDIAELQSGVAKAGISFKCGKTVDVYIVPTGGGVATQQLLDYVKDAYYDETRMVTTAVRVLSAGELTLSLTADVRVLPAFNRTSVEAAVRQNLQNYFGSEDRKLSEGIEIGNIYEVIENTEGVDFSKVILITVLPFARILSGDNALDWTRVMNAGSTGVVRWRLRFSTAGEFDLQREDQYAGTYQLEQLVNKPEISFTLLDAGYAAGDSWEFYTYPYNDSFAVSEPSVAVLYDSAVTLNMTGGV